MTRRQFYVAMVVLAVSGTVGGALLNWLLIGRIAYAQEGYSANEVRAKRFVVIDDSGAAKAEFGTIVGSPHLTLYDEAGDMSIRLVSGLLGAPRLIIYGAEDKKIELGYIDDGEGPFFRFFEGEQDIRMLLYMINGEPTLTFKDEAGQYRMILGRPYIVPLEEGKVNSIMLLDETGDVQWQAP